MFNSTRNNPTVLKIAVAATLTAALVFSPLALAQEQVKEKLDAAAGKTVTGEVVDMMCYVDHNAAGDKHASCAAPSAYRHRSIITSRNMRRLSSTNWNLLPS